MLTRGVCVSKGAVSQSLDSFFFFWVGGVGAGWWHRCLQAWLPSTAAGAAANSIAVSCMSFRVVENFPRRRTPRWKRCSSWVLETRRPWTAGGRLGGRADNDDAVTSPASNPNLHDVLPLSLPQIGPDRRNFSVNALCIRASTASAVTGHGDQQGCHERRPKQLIPPATSRP